MKKKIAVLGAGVSGFYSAILAHKKHYNVFLSEKKKIKTKYKKILLNNNIKFEELGHNIKNIINVSLVIKSPGISDAEDIIQQLKKHKIKIISEIEFALKYNKHQIIAITGSNGKTTTSTIIHYLLKIHKITSVLCGNIGTPLSKIIILNIKVQFCVLELSSFQLDNLINFNPKISIILNISPNHLNRYNHKINNYIKSKTNICKYQSKNNFFIYNKDDENITLKNIFTCATKLTFSLENNTCHAFVKNKYIIIDNKKIIQINKINLKGYHNIYNIMSALLTINLLCNKINKKKTRQFFINFKGLQHRLEYIANINNITFINDSKSTNIISTYQAIQTIKQPIIWIAGGVDQGNIYTPKIINCIIKRVKSIVLLGNNKKIFNIFKGFINPIITTYNMKKAVKNAFDISKSGYVILLSPACASFNMFKNYHDRGIQFKHAIKNVKR